MLYKSLILGLLIVFTLPTVAVEVEEIAAGLLTKVVHGFPTQAYKASAVYIRPSGTESVNIERDGEFEKITFNNHDEHTESHLFTQGKIIFQTAGQVNVHHNKTRFHSLKYFQENQTKSLESYGLFVSKNNEQVAGIKSTRLSIISNDESRYSYIYWLDAKNYIILRTDTLNEHGELIERMLFTSFILNKTDEASILEKINFKSKYAIHYYHQNTQDNQPVQLNWLPSGFKLILSESVYDNDNVFLYRYFLLTDGLSSIKVYLDGFGHEAKLTRGQQLDAFHVYKGTVNGKKLSVEGHMPYEILKKVGLNMNFERNND